MKVLIFASQFVHGAAERLQAELAIDLNRRGIRADMLGLHYLDSAAVKDARDALLNAGVPRVDFLNIPVHPGPANLIIAIIRLSLILLRNRYQVVETSAATPSIIASLACLLSGTKHLCGIHRTYSADDDSGFRVRLFQRAVTFFGRCRFYAVSNFARRKWIDYAKVPPSRVKVVYNCHFIEGMAESSHRERIRNELGISQQNKVILCAGRLAAYKNTDLVLEAVLPICESHDIVVLLAGEIDYSVRGTPQMLARIETLLKAGSLRGRVRFLGLRSDVRRLMAAADILVHAATREAFGMVLAEAMAVGLPIVAAASEGVPEVLQDTHSVLVPPMDATALREGITTMLLKTSDELALIARNGKQRAAQFHRSLRSLAMKSLCEDLTIGAF